MARATRGEPKATSAGAPSPGRRVRLSAAGEAFEAFVATPAGPWTSASIVVGENDSLDAGVMAVASDLATSGHAALAMGHASKSGSEEDLAHFVERVHAGFACLKGQALAPAPRFGVVGFGQGGALALAVGYRCRLGASVSFYGEGPAYFGAHVVAIVDHPRRQVGPFLFLFGGDDPAVRPSDLGAIQRRLDFFGMRHTFIVYPRTKGAFCRRGSPDYRESEAADAWQRLLHALETAPRPRHRFTKKTPEAPAAPVRAKATRRTPL
jgi:dienelactone hydrolase